MNLSINYSIIDLNNNVVAQHLDMPHNEDSFLHWLENFEAEHPSNFHLAIQVIDRDLGAHVFGDAVQLQELDYDSTTDLMNAMGL